MIGGVLKALAGWKGYAVAAGAAAVVGFSGGYGLRDLQADAADKDRAEAAARAARKVIKRIGVADAITADVGKKAETRQVEIRWQTRTLIREVPVYVTPETDRRFLLPVGLVRVHDAAALGVSPTALPDPAGRADDAASDVAPSELGAAVVDNYGTCRADQARLADLQSWVEQQQAAWAAPD